MHTKLFCITLCALVSASVFPKSSTKSAVQGIKVALMIKKTDEPTTHFELDEHMKSCVKFLESFAKTQKKRQLTVEDMSMIMDCCLCMLYSEHDDYTKGIEIFLPNGDKISVPFSKYFLMQIIEYINKDLQDQKHD